MRVRVRVCVCVASIDTTSCECVLFHTGVYMHCVEGQYDIVHPLLGVIIMSHKGQ